MSSATAARAAGSMTSPNFDACLPLTLVYEGGFVDNPKDPGGATNKGITQAVYDTWRRAQGLPTQSVRYISGDEVRSIYATRYWQQAGCNGLPVGLDYAVFDFAVNSGVGRAVTTLQSIVGAVRDGHAGPDTLAAVRTHGTPLELIGALCDARMTFLQSLPTYVYFGAGWKRRVMGAKQGAQAGDTGVIDRAIAMAGGYAVPQPSLPLKTVKTYRDFP